MEKIGKVAFDGMNPIEPPIESQWSGTFWDSHHPTTIHYPAAGDTLKTWVFPVEWPGQAWALKILGKPAAFHDEAAVLTVWTICLASFTTSFPTVTSLSSLFGRIPVLSHFRPYVMCCAWRSGSSRESASLHQIYPPFRSLSQQSSALQMWGVADSLWSCKVNFWMQTLEAKEKDKRSHCLISSLSISTRHWTFVPTLNGNGSSWEWLVIQGSKYFPACQSA